MAKIKIKDLCNQLIQRKEEKSLFFRDLFSEKFLVYFFEAKIFNFNDQSSFWQVKYLHKIYSDNTKEIITNILNSCIQKCDISTIDDATYYQIINLIDLFDSEHLCKINIIKLFKHKQSIKLINIVCKRSQFINDKKITKALLDSLLRFKLTNSYKKIAEIDHEIYDFSKLVSDEETSESLKTLLKQDFVFEFLIKRYKKVYRLIKKERNTIYDVFTNYTFDPQATINQIKNEYHSDNYLDIIILFISFNLNRNDEKIRQNIEKLLSEDVYTLRKFALYIINSNTNKYIDLFRIFFDNINKNNIVKVTQICLYEIVEIFRKLEKEKIDELLLKSINDYLEKFPKMYEKIKYDVLHGLKNNEDFREKFDSLKNKYQYEKEHPGIYFSEGIGGFVKDVSPISEIEFKDMTISEQIDYLNSVEYTYNLVQIDNNTVEEKNERGLIKLFENTISPDINRYIEDGNIFQLKKINFKNSLIDVFTKNIDKINNLNKVILYIDNILKDALENFEENRDLLYSILDFNIAITSKNHKFFSRIFDFIQKISRKEYNETYYSNEQDSSFISWNTIHGRNFRCYIEHLTKIKKLSKKDNDFVSYILGKKNEKRFCTLYYYLGMQFQYIASKYPKLDLTKKIYSLSSEPRKYFLEGYLSFGNHIKYFKEIKELILESFKNNEIQENRVRTRFIHLLTNYRLILDEKPLFKEFSIYFSPHDFNNVLNCIIYRENDNLNKEKVIDLWNEFVKQNNKDYTDQLISIFNKYCDINDIKNMEQQLISIFKCGLPDNLVANPSIGKFINKLLTFIRETKNCATSYNILEKIINSLKDVKYIYKETKFIEDILFEFEKCEKIENARLLAEKIYKIPNLCMYFTNIKNYL